MNREIHKPNTSVLGKRRTNLRVRQDDIHENDHSNIDVAVVSIPAACKYAMNSS